MLLGVEMGKIPVSKLKECLECNPATGELVWKTRPASHFRSGSKSAAHLAAIWNASHAGKQAFTGVGNHGYHVSSIGGIRMSAHRVIWAIHYGQWPSGELDHVNGVRTDNRIANLRQVSRKENAKNLAVKSGSLRGVYWYGPTKRWVAKIHSDGKMLHLGYHQCLGKAIASRRDAEVQLGFHPNHGRAF